MTEAEQKTNRNPWLDLCRAVAILLVLLSHGRVFLRDMLPSMEVLRFGGFMGVELFFVLSGFLIGRILIRYSSRPAAEWLRLFYIRRWLRTLPNYYLFLVLNLLLVWLGVRPGDLADAWRYALFMQNLFAPPPVFFQEAWSLAVEEIFYLLFPAGFLLVARFFHCSPKFSILYAALAVIIASLFARFAVAVSVISWEEQIRKVVFLRFDTLMYGVMLAWFYVYQRSLLRFPIALAGIIVFAACAGYFALHTDAELNASMFAKTVFLSLASLGCAGLVIAGLNWRMEASLTKVAGFVARVSYLAYLTNLPIAILLVYLFPCCNNDPIGASAIWLTYMVLTLLSAHLIQNGFERPINRWRDRCFPG